MEVSKSKSMKSRQGDRARTGRVKVHGIGRARAHTWGPYFKFFRPQCCTRTLLDRTFSCRGYGTSQRRASSPHTSRALPSPRLGRPPPRDGRQTDQICGGAAGPGLPSLQARVPRARPSMHLGQMRPHVLPRLHRGADSGGRHVPAGRAGVRLGPTGPQPAVIGQVRVCVRMYGCVHTCVCACACITVCVHNNNNNNNNSKCACYVC